MRRPLPLSTDDFKSGRFEALADHVRAEWPFNNRPARESVLDIVAYCLGYNDYSDARSQATEVAVASNDFGIDKLDISNRFERLGFAPKEPEVGSPERPYSMDEFFSGKFMRTNIASDKFVESWPINMVGRWNYSGSPVDFDRDFIADHEELFSRLWMFDSREHSGFQEVTKNNKSAASVAASLIVGLSVETISGMKISDVIDAEIAEALFQDVMPLLIGEIFTVSINDIVVLTNQTGNSMRDLWEMPRNEASFPSLYQHMRKVMTECLLERRLVDLFMVSREENGWYTGMRGFNSALPCIEVEVPEGKFLMQVDRNYLECEYFRNYMCLAQLQDTTGKVIARFGGTYLAGPANKDIAGFDMISALDEVCDDDVEVGDMVLSLIQMDLMSDVDDEFFDDEEVELIEKSSINANLIFCDGNLLIVSAWERSPESEKGCGIILLNYCVHALKKKFRRNMSVACILDPAQYGLSSQKVEVLEEQRRKDMGKIHAHLMNLEFTDFVPRVYAAGRVHSDGPSTFSKYCGEAYIGDESCR